MSINKIPITNLVMKLQNSNIFNDSYCSLSRNWVRRLPVAEMQSMLQAQELSSAMELKMTVAVPEDYI